MGMTHVQRLFSLAVPRVEQRCTERDSMRHGLGPGLRADPPSAQAMPRRAPDSIAEWQPRLHRALRCRLSRDHNPPHGGPALRHAVAGFARGSA